MRTHQKSVLVLTMIAALMATALFLPGLVGAGDLEPSGSPDSTMKTLDEIPPTWSQILPASERFELVMGGEAVLDKETGLVWAKNANLAGASKDWQGAMNYCRQNVSIANRKGWRLPTIEELASLVDSTQEDPALPSGCPFVNVEFAAYWSSTKYEGDDRYARAVSMGNGQVFNGDRLHFYFVWPVRGGQ